MTLREARRIAAQRLEAAGLEEARLEARWLVAWAAELSAEQLMQFEDTELTPLAHKQLDEALVARAARVPLAHIMGKTPFHAITLLSDARALIPRSDSECVVDLALDLLPQDSLGCVADLGTGTGCLLLAILAARRAMRGIGVDLSPEALALARENTAWLDFEARVHLFQGGWTDWTGWTEADLIISNPPYIATDVIETLAPDVREHDPRLALDGGPDGLAAYREIIALGAARMKAGAWLVLEIGYDQKAPVSALLEEAGFTDLIHRKDLGGNDRAIAARRVAQ